MNDIERLQRSPATCDSATASPSDQSVLSYSDLLPGDVLLHRPKKPGFVQRRIAAVTDSPYTHASIYIGDGKVAEAVAKRFLKGVVKSDVATTIEDCLSIGVLRSQYGFTPDRPQQLEEFVERVSTLGLRYNTRAIFTFKRNSKRYFDDQLQHIRDHYGKSDSNESLARRSYFCSAFVVSCYKAVGIIGKNGQAAYPSDVFSPGDLARDPTFGWLLGYLLPKEGSIPTDDPLAQTANLWSDCPELKWW